MRLWEQPQERKEVRGEAPCAPRGLAAQQDQAEVRVWGGPLCAKGSSSPPQQSVAFGRFGNVGGIPPCGLEVICATD